MSAIEIEFFFAHPPERVWKALTDAKLIDRWLMRNDFKPLPGREFTFVREPQPGFDGAIRGEVLEAEAPRRLVYTWRAAGLETLLTWTLSPEAGGTLLGLRHSGFHGALGFLVRGMVEKGWDQMADGEFPRVLEQLARRRPVTGSGRRR